MKAALCMTGLNSLIAQTNNDKVWLTTANAMTYCRDEWPQMPG